ncbi:MAG: cytochrome c1 [Caulobacterales bacterium]
MLRKVTVLAALAGLLIATPALAANTSLPLKPVHWSFQGPFGKYDQEQLQRGFKVYHDVCASCHSLKLIAFRNLGDPGGPFWDRKYKTPNDNAYVKSIAAEYKIPDIDSETGDPIQRPATSADYFPWAFPNEVAARGSNGGALPPDMSLLVKARDGGPAYIYSLLTGYAPAPDALPVPPGKFYNPYLPGDLTSQWKGDAKHVPVGGLIAMPPPLSDDRVTYDDGVKATTDQEAQDVAAFLNWAADPKMEERKQTGLAVMIYLLLFAGVMYASYKTIWRNVEH